MPASVSTPRLEKAGAETRVDREIWCPRTLYDTQFFQRFCRAWQSEQNHELALAEPVAELVMEVAPRDVGSLSRHRNLFLGESILTWKLNFP